MQLENDEKMRCETKRMGKTRVRRANRIGTESTNENLWGKKSEMDLQRMSG